MIDWNEKDPTLTPPFDTWPRWALELDREIADVMGSLTAGDEITAEEEAALNAYDAVRETIEEMIGERKYLLAP